ncbi:hypothetical protein HGRIS_010426 [Hohenbuehelia grisea]|uniref:Uncharacterized protein n=1 Tax=Hohenbuehelia grisea TaxID=104357 RepID=A0ABR3IZH9_9AGAR
MGPLLGTLYVNKLIERFSESGSQAKQVYAEFGHDTTIVSTLTTLGVAKDVPALRPDRFRPERKFKTDELAPFAGRMVFEKFSCKRSFSGPQIRLVLNDSPKPLKACEKSLGDLLYGSCSFKNFVKANAFSTSIKWGDETWNRTCGPSDF